MTPDLTFVLLADRPDEIPRVARWWCNEWGLPSRHATFDDYVRELLPGTLPIHLLADQGGHAVGVATLKLKIDHPVMVKNVAS
jgi:hypothetical protein